MATRRSRKRQTQLAFTPAPTSSPGRSSQPESIRHRAAFVSIDSPSPRKALNTARQMLPTPRASYEASTKEASSPFSKRVTRSFLGGAGSSPLTKKRKGHSARVVSESGSESESDEEPRVLRSSGSQKKVIVIESEGESDADEQDETARRTGASADVWRRNGINILNDSESDVPVATSSAIKKRRLQRPAKMSTVEIDDSSDDGHRLKSSPPVAGLDGAISSPPPEDKDEEDLPVRPRKRRRPASTIESEEADEDDEDDDLPHPRTKRSRKAPSPAPEPRSEQDQADLESDLEFLGDANTESPRALRLGSASTKKQGRREMLDALKRKRAKKEQKANASRAQKSRRVVDDESDIVSSSDNSEIDDAEYEDARWTYEQAGADDDFVINDEGEPAAALPLAFSNYATMKPIELFKFVVEWMVQKKINPAFAITDDIYTLAFNRLDDFVSGMGSSKFQSSAWTPNFSKSLRGRPQIADTRVGANLMYDRCDACNRSGHTPTYEVYFEGLTYKRDTLEEIEEESDDDEDEPAPKPDAPPASTLYRVGKYCMRNAKQAHAFRHWKFHLNEWVIDCLEGEGELKPEKIVARDSWSTKKRRKDANRIVDEMDRRGDIKTLQRDFKNQIEGALNCNNDVGRSSSA